MKASLRMRHERELCLRDENRDRKDEIDLRVLYDSWWHEIGGGKKDTRGQHVDTRTLKAHRTGGNGTRVERAGQAESRRHGETSGCFEKVHTLLALCTRHLRSPPFSSLLVRRHSSPYR